MIENIIVYHTNTKDEIEPFVNDKRMIYHDDTHYLGYGMYFWDNQGNARYWARKKLRERTDLDEVYITQARLIFSTPILDLTDIEVIRKVRDLWIIYCDKLGEKNTNQFFGTILNILRKYFPTLDEMKISKCHGDYSQNKKQSFLSRLGNKSYIDSRPKTIYSIRCESVISETIIFENIKRT
jgi:hypothetical protein